MNNKGYLKFVVITLAIMACTSCKREERGFTVEPPSADRIETLRMSDVQAGPGSNDIAAYLGLTNSPATNGPSTNMSAPPATHAPATNTPSSGTNAPPSAKTDAPTSSTNAPAAAASTNSPPTNAPTSTNIVAPSAQAVASTNAAHLDGQSFAPLKNEYEDNAYALSEGQRLFSSFNCVGCHGHGGGGMGPPLMDSKWIYGSNPEQIFATIVQGRPNGMPSFHGRIPDYQVWQLAAYVRSMSGLVRKDAAPGRTEHMQNKPPENSTNPEKPKISTTH